MIRWCNKCGAVEIEPQRGIDEFGEFDIWTCPFCGKETTEADRCQCGNYKSVETDYCPDCYEEVESEISETARDLKKKGFRGWQAVDLIGQVLDKIEDDEMRKAAM